MTFYVQSHIFWVREAVQCTEQGTKKPIRMALIPAPLNDGNLSLSRAVWLCRNEILNL